MNAEITARILGPIWSGFFLSQLIIKEEIAKMQAGENKLDLRSFGELLDAGEYLRYRAQDYDSLGLLIALGRKPHLFPYPVGGDLSEAFAECIRALFEFRPEIRKRADKVGMGMDGLEKLCRDIQLQQERVKRLQEREPAEAFRPVCDA